MAWSRTDFVEGVTVPGISISKNVTLKGMNGLQGAVTINSFDLPADDPAGGITLTLATTIVNVNAPSRYPRI